MTHNVHYPEFCLFLYVQEEERDYVLRNRRQLVCHNFWQYVEEDVNITPDGNL